MPDRSFLNVKYVKASDLMVGDIVVTEDTRFRSSNTSRIERIDVLPHGQIELLFPCFDSPTIATDGQILVTKHTVSRVSHSAVFAIIPVETQ